MYIVYRIFNKTTNEYYISYSNKSLPEILNKKLYEYLTNKRWHVCFLLFREDYENLGIEKLTTFFECQQSCISFIKIYEYYNGGCINYRENPNLFI